MKKTSKKVDILEVLFGSPARVRILRHVLSNPDRVFTLTELVKKTKCKETDIKKEIKLLNAIQCIKDRICVVESVLKNGKTNSKKILGIISDPQFIYKDILTTLLAETITLQASDISKRIQATGKFDLIVASGFFIGDSNRMADLLIVGNMFNKQDVERVLVDIESELGRDISYALMTTEEFLYRLKMYDKLISDILDYPHEKLLIKIEHPDILKNSSQA